MIALALAACSGAPEASDTDAPKATDIRALRWIAPGADRVKALTSMPPSCARQPDLTRRTAAQFVGDEVIGAIAFESPALLGGAAGRMGLSCASCHVNGRGNPDFMLEGVSGGAGTADITGNLLSKVRGDGVFNPLPIPDLAARDGRQMRDRKAPEFRTKIHALVVEEFDGQEPPSAVFNALLTYLDTLDVRTCPDRATDVQLSPMHHLLSAALSARAAGDFARTGDKDAAILLARMSREALERAHERFVAADQADVREALVAASGGIGQWMESVRRDEPGTEPIGLIDAASVLASRKQAHSLYNPDVLRAALAR